MGKKRVPLHIITLWHPESWMGIPVSELSSLPCVQRSRVDLERKRQEVAQLRSLDAFWDYFHERPILNLGKPVDQLRKTWIRVDKLIPCIEDFDPRLISTLGEGKQARYRLEYRFDWGGDPTVLDTDVRNTIINNIKQARRLSVRQLWRNPVAARFGALPLPVPEGIASEVANLVLGPFDEKECPRRAELNFDRLHNAWWIAFPE